MGEEKSAKEGLNVIYEKIKNIHQKTTEEMWLLEKSLPFLTSENARKDIEKVVNFIKDTVLTHFDWEEHDVFPVALAVGDLDIKQEVRKLQQQHIGIIAKFDILVDIVIKNGFSFKDETVKTRFAETAKEMITLTLRHSHQEDEKLYPFLMAKGVPITKYSSRPS